MGVPPKPQQHFLKPHSVSRCIQLCTILIFNKLELLYFFTGLQDPVFYLPSTPWLQKQTRMQDHEPQNLYWSLCDSCPPG